MITRSTVMLNPFMMLAIKSWVSGRSFGISLRNPPITCPMAGSTLMTNTFSSFPTKSAQPLLAGRIPRICTGTTSFFIPSLYDLNLKKQVCEKGPGTAASASGKGFSNRAAGRRIPSFPRLHGNLAVVLKNREMDLLHAGATGGAQGGIQFMMGQFLAAHHFLEQPAVMDEHLRPAFDQRLEPLALERAQADDVVQPDQGDGRNHSSQEG